LLNSIELLLVEDNPGDIRLTQEALSEVGIKNRLAVARSGAEAIHFLSQTSDHNDAPRPDLVFLDLNIPRKSGQEVLRWMKAREQFRRIPVVVLTTSQSETDIRRSYSNHANCVITKPVDFEKFVAVVAGILRFWMQIVRLPSNILRSDER